MKQLIKYLIYLYSSRYVLGMIENYEISNLLSVYLYKIQIKLKTICTSKYFKIRNKNMKKKRKNYDYASMA